MKWLIINGNKIICLLAIQLFAISSAMAAEKDELASALRLLDHVQAAFERARVAAVQADPASRSRYFFDYSRATEDLNTIRAGIDRYLEPSRAQPRTPGEIIGSYQRERP